MIKGIIPIGGFGTRLGMTFSKEMLPQRNFNYYNPISNHLVSKMIDAGAEKIIFIHGNELKTDVTSFFTNEIFIHICQKKPGFANVLLEFLDYDRPAKNDVLFFGMPDTIFENNPFIKMSNMKDVVACTFITDNYSSVDRLEKNMKNFKVKSQLEDDLLDRFWGVLKFDGKNLLDANKKNLFEKYTEVGDIINSLSFETVEENRYIDLGTWNNYNRYLSHGYYGPLNHPATVYHTDSGRSSQ